MSNETRNNDWIPLARTASGTTRSLECSSYRGVTSEGQRRPNRAQTGYLVNTGGMPEENRGERRRYQLWPVRLSQRVREVWSEARLYMSCEALRVGGSFR